MTCCQSSCPEPVSTVTVNQTIIEFGEGNEALYRQDALFLDLNLQATLTAVPASMQAVGLYINGVLQNQGEHYTVNGQTITVNTQPPAGSTIIAKYLSAESESVSGVAIGAILGFGGTVAPSGFLLCNGAAVSRAGYSALFAVIGTTYGVGDGSTTFNLPTLQSPYYNGTTLVTGTSIIKYQ